jgi:hypothetical protein
MFLALSVFISGCTTTTTVTTTATTTQTTTTTLITTTTTESLAQISFNEEFWELGTYPQNDFVYHDLIITNTGTGDLYLEDVNPPCGCTNLDRAKYPLTLKPGESHTASIVFSTGTYSGLITKYINILSNDTLRPQVSLMFTCNVVPATTST